MPQPPAHQIRHDTKEMKTVAVGHPTKLGRRPPWWCALRISAPIIATFVCFVLVIVRYLSSFQNSSGGAGGVVKCDVDLGPRRGFAR
jgi:hypothetical protein